MRLQVALATGFFAPALFLAANAAHANALHKQGEAVVVAESTLTVTPPRDWNQLGKTIGKHTETWTLDGEQLDDVTFFGGIASGDPLARETGKLPLPKFTRTTVLAEIPALVDDTSRASGKSSWFRVISTAPIRFLNQDGIAFTYEFTDEDQLTRQGEARAAIVGGKLYMITFEAPRLHYFAKVLPDFHAMADTAKLR